MDETLSRVALDVSGRAYLVWRVRFTAAKLGEMDTELFREFFQAFAPHAGLALHIETLFCDNKQHIAENCFQSLAPAPRAPAAIHPRQAGRVPSTKGTLSV